jgi:hypothetical protein
MLARMRRARVLALPFAVVLVVSALLAAAHTHGADEGETEGLAFSSVRVSIISNPDAHGDETHWHAGRTVVDHPCAACLLLHQAGSVGGGTPAPPVDIALRTPGFAELPLPDVHPRPARARAPPSCC